MKRLSGILLLILYLFFGTGFNQLLKLPVLVQHFEEHKETDSSLSFFEFLHMHYAGDDHNDKDQDRDMQLPFKSDHNYASTNIGFNAFHAQSISFQLIPITTEKITAYNRLNLQSDYLSSIWQPPEFC